MNLNTNIRFYKFLDLQERVVCVGYEKPRSELLSGIRRKPDHSPTIRPHRHLVLPSQK
jgi:uncharacterized protein (DUF2461 family)